MAILLCITYSHCSLYPKCRPSGSELGYGGNHSSPKKRPNSLNNGFIARRPTRREAFGLHKLCIGYSSGTHQVEHHWRNTSSERGDDGTGLCGVKFVLCDQVVVLLFLVCTRSSTLVVELKLQGGLISWTFHIFKVANFSSIYSFLMSIVCHRYSK